MRIPQKCYIESTQEVLNYPIWQKVSGVLVAISIPIFTSQLEKAREATDLANVRAAYAEVMTAALTEDSKAEYKGTIIKQANGSYKAEVTLTQAVDGWTTDTTNLDIGGVKASDTTHWTGTPKAKGKCVITYTPGSADGTTAESLSFAWS